MALSYYGINVSQDELGKSLRPYQIASGVNDDKTVLLAELAEKSKEYDLIPYYRPNGSIKLIRAFIANDIPILVKTWTKENEDIGHYRIVKGYDDTTSQIIQDDSLQGKYLKYSYDSFNKLWEKFNFEYLVLVPLEKQTIAEEILAGNLDEKTAWANALERAKETLSQNPNDPYAIFNLSIAYYYLGEYQKAVDEYEKVENKLPFRTLWYQIEPIKSYYELGNYDRVFSITDRILNNQNLAFSELYMIRGETYLKQGNKEAAKKEFEKAVLYNTNFSSKIPQL
jgi:tetratricopeptide (TPR) repeat protein